MKAIPVGIKTQEEAMMAARESLRIKKESILRCEQMIAEMKSSLRAIARLKQ